jgi:FixJ family two-component response regulator
MGWPLSLWILDRGARQFLDSSDCDKVSCVVSDILMPGVTGLELQAVLRDRVPHLSILFITAYGEIPDTVSAMKAGPWTFWRSRSGARSCWKRSSGPSRALTS